MELYLQIILKSDLLQVPQVLRGSTQTNWSGSNPRHLQGPCNERKSATEKKLQFP